VVNHDPEGAEPSAFGGDARTLQQLAMQAAVKKPKGLIGYLTS